MKCPIFVALIVCVVLGVSLLPDELSAASFQPLGEHYYAYGVSADGSVVVGVGYPQGFPGEAFRWTQSSGWVGLGFLPGGDSSGASAASADGSVIVGQSNSSAGTEAFRWTADGGMVGLGDLPGGNHDGDARAVSDDGSVIVGMSSSSVGGNRAFRWTQSSGMVPLDVPGYARGSGKGISGDGLVAVGGAVNVQGSPEAFRWTSGSAITMGDLPGGRFTSTATSASFDGAVVVGYGSSSAHWEEAYRWTESTGMVGLGVLPSSITNPYSEALDVSADGSVIVGQSLDDSHAEAFLWDTVHGMRSLQDVLSAAGIDLTGWQLHRAYGVSADGMVIVGEGDNPSGQTEGWLARLNTVLGNPDFNNDGQLNCTDIDALVAEIAAGTNISLFDLTGDGIVDTADLDEWRVQAGAANLPSGNPYLPGDANLDGYVDVSDFNVWNSHRLSQTPAWCSGDFNADGFVDASDWNVWNSHRLMSSGDTVVVPEPASLWLSFVALGWLIAHRRLR